MFQIVLSVLLTLVAQAAAHAQSRSITALPAQAKTVVAISGATVIDGAGSRPLRNSVILIEGNRISAVGPAAKIRIPLGAQVINATGKFVIPGLADMHFHLGQADLPHMLAWGFTTVFNPGHDDLSAFTKLKALEAQDSSRMPHFFGVGRAITVKGGHASAPRYGSAQPETPEEGRRTVQEMKHAGADAIKLIYDDLSQGGRPPAPIMRPEAMQSIIDESHRLGLKVYAHAPQLRHAKEVLRAGVDWLIHALDLDRVDEELLALMKQKGALYVTTHSLYNALSDRSGWADRLQELDHRGVIAKATYKQLRQSDRPFPARPVSLRDALRYNLRRLYDAGVLVVAGTDTPVLGVLAGVSSQAEIVLLVEDGLKPEEALRTATLNAAKMMGRDHEQGSIDAGKLADLVILDANPLADIRNIRFLHRVVKSGVLYDPNDWLKK